VIQGQLEPLAQQELLVHQVHQELLVLQVLLVQLDLPVQQEPQALLVQVLQQVELSTNSW
jgi:hypothetical protein